MPPYPEKMRIPPYPEKMKKMHKIPIGTLVEIKIDPEEPSGWDGIRLYIVEHERDWDGTPLYKLGKKGNCNCYSNHGGFSDRCLTIIKEA